MPSINKTLIILVRNILSSIMSILIHILSFHINPTLTSTRKHFFKVFRIALEGNIYHCKESRGRNYCQQVCLGWDSLGRTCVSNLSSGTPSGQPWLRSRRWWACDTRASADTPRAWSPQTPALVSLSCNLHFICLKLKEYFLTRPEKGLKLRKKGLKGFNRNFGLNWINMGDVYIDGV